jgi:hypothetical protein
MTSAEISTESLTVSGKKFIRRTYNGISIVVFEENGYISATRIAIDNGKEIRDYIDSKEFAEVVVEWRKRVTDGTKPYNQISGGDVKFRGTYVHPNLVHFVAHWADIKYAFKVQTIMDSINDQNNAAVNQIVAELKEKAIEMDDEIDELKSKIEDLELEKYELTDVNDGLKSSIYDLKSEITDLTEANNYLKQQKAILITETDQLDSLTKEQKRELF